MSDDYSAKRISDTLCELRSIGDTVAYQLGDDNTESRAARIIEQLQRKLESAESRLGDCGMMMRRLIARIQRRDPNDMIAEQAVELLARYELQGSILRDSGSGCRETGDTG